MRILILTRQDPISVPVYLGKLAKDRSAGIVAIVAVSAPPYLTRLSFLGKRLKELGVKDALLKALHIYIGSLLNLIGRFVALKRFYSLESLAKNYGIPLYHIDNIKTEEFYKFVRGLKPDIILSVTCPKLIKKELLDIPPLGCINVHCSLLPEGRGNDPAFWSLYQGHKVTGITIHYMDEEMDNGDIISQTVFAISPKDTLESLYRKIAKVSANAIVSVLDDVEKGIAQRLPNDKERATYFGVSRKGHIYQLRRQGRKLIRLKDCFLF